jgi:anti-sigma factor RsiW
MRTTDVNQEQFEVLLAGYVDGQLSAEARQRVERELSRHAELRDKLEQQQAAAQAYAAYPVETPGDDAWKGAWTRIEERLPHEFKRVSLETLTDLTADDEFVAEEEASTLNLLAETRGAVLDPRSTGAARLPVGGERTQAVRLTARQNRRPIHLPQPRQRSWSAFWAHAAGLAAVLAILAMVLLSVQPIIHTRQLAAYGEIEFDFAADSAGFVDTLRVDDNTYVQIVWVNYSPAEAAGHPEEPVQ